MSIAGRELPAIRRCQPAAGVAKMMVVHAVAVGFTVGSVRSMSPARPPDRWVSPPTGPPATRRAL